MTKPSPQTIRKKNPIWNGFKGNQKVISTLQFEALPNEIICHVFSFLKMMDLLTCGQVSKRFRAIINDRTKSASWISSKFTGQWN